MFYDIPNVITNSYIGKRFDIRPYQENPFQSSTKRL